MRVWGTLARLLGEARPALAGTVVYRTSQVESLPPREASSFWPGARAL